MKSLRVYEKDASNRNWVVGIGSQCCVGSVMLLLAMEDREGKNGTEPVKLYTYVTFKTQVTIRFCTFKPQCPGRPCE
jgi:hypothetical protein